MNKKNELTNEDLLLLNDPDFLLRKVRIIKKIEKLFEETRFTIKSFLVENNFNLPKQIYLKTGKISKGENYKSLPYLVLDYPSLFTNEDTFAYRTMFWWGNFFSCTFHLQGKSLANYRSNLFNNFKKLLGKNIYICVGETPWEYHYEKENYVLLNNSHKQFFNECDFLKLSKKVELKDWESLPIFSTEFFKQLLEVLN